LQGTAYTSGTATGGNSGTPFRAILDQMGAAGIPVGGGSDATNVGALNPWLMMYFMITGKNNAGVVINNVTIPMGATNVQGSRVTVNYPFSFIVLQPVARLIVHGSLTGAPITMTAVAEMRNETQF